MAETATETPPVQETKPLTGSAAFEAQMSNLTPVADIKDKVPEKPVEKPAEVPADKSKPAAKPAAKPAEKPAAKPADKPAEKVAELRWETAPKQFKEAHEKLKSEHQKLQEAHQSEISKLNTRLAELDKRKVLTPEQEAEYQKKEKRLSDLEAELYARDFTQSPDYKKEYKEKWDKHYATSLNRVKGMSVKYQEGDEEKTRQATQADFEKVRLSPETEQYGVANQLFGQHAFMVLQDINALKAIQDAAEEAIETKRKTWEETQKQESEKRQNESKQYQALTQEYDNVLVQKWPEQFGDDGKNPELTTALQRGMAFVDDVLKNGMGWPVDERAKVNAIIRRQAGMFEHNQLLIKNLKAEIASRDEELAKYRKSLPGSEEPTDGGEKKSSTVKGSDGLAMQVVGSV